MSSTNNCPDPSTLRRLLLGDLAVESQAIWEQHLENCERCVAASETIVASDDLTEAIRLRPAINFDQEVVDEAIARGKQLSSPAGDPTGTIAIQGDSRQVESDADRFCVNEAWLTTILREPQEPDELGRLGGYRVLKVLGVGGMGVVFQADDPKLDRHVALKVMKPSLAASRTAKERFLREARATAAIEHHNIVPIYQVGEEAGIPFIAMQLLRGESLRQRLSRDPKLSDEEVIQIGVDVAHGLHAAHETGLTHRDIKPDNLWIDEKTGFAKILDFGLVTAASDDSGVTLSGTVVGTPRYMSPEQANAEDVGPKSDLFSLGSVLFQMVTGVAPFESGNATATLVSVASGTAPNIIESASGIHPQLAGIVMRLLEREPGDRPESALAVAAELSSISTDQFNQVELARKTSSSTQNPTDGDSSSPTAEAYADNGVRGGSLWFVLAGFAGFAFLFAGVVFKFATRDGTVVVSVTGQPSIASVTIDERQVSFSREGTNQDIRFSVSPGTHQFTLMTEDGVELATELRTEPLVVNAGKLITLRAWLQPAETPKPVDSIVVDEPNLAGDPLVSPDDNDRLAAEWVLSIEGTLRLIDTKEGNPVELQGEALPEMPFWVVSVEVNWKDVTDEQLIEYLGGLTHLVHINLTGNSKLTHRSVDAIVGANPLFQKLLIAAVDGPDAKCIASASRLGMVGVAANQLSDAALNAIQMHPTLHRITVDIASEEGEKNLAAALAKIAASERLTSVKVFPLSESAREAVRHGIALPESQRPDHKWVYEPGIRFASLETIESPKTE